MDYNLIIDLNNVTLEECFDLYEKKNMTTIINDGRIINFEKEENIWVNVLIIYYFLLIKF